MSSGKSALFVGGTRSGKSAMAQRWTEAQAGQRIYMATSVVEDEETAQRVARHQEQRGEGWSTLEASLDVRSALQALSTNVVRPAVMVDCVTVWLSNLMARQDSEQNILEQVEALGQWLRMSPLPVALVTGEVGQGIVPMSSLGRRYRDLHGEANQILAAACSTVVLVTCGLPLALKGALPEEICAIS